MAASDEVSYLLRDKFVVGLRRNRFELVSRSFSRGAGSATEQVAISLPMRTCRVTYEINGKQACDLRKRWKHLEAVLATGRARDITMAKKRPRR